MNINKAIRDAQLYEVYENDMNTDMDMAADYMEGLVKALYTTGDKDKLHDMVEELCALFNVDMPDGKMRVTETADTKKHFILGYQRALLDMTKSKEEQDERIKEMING